MPTREEAAKPGSLSSQGTRDRILNTALRLFADNGFSETSLRMITTEAGVTVPADNSPSAPKDANIGEVFGRLVGPVNRERLARLDRLEASAGKGPLDLEELVRAFLTPALGAWKRIGSIAIRLMGRTYADSSDHILKIFKEQFGEVLMRFAIALQRALPGLDQKEVLWRLQFAVGAMVHTMIAHDRLKTVFPELDDPAAADDLTSRLTAFICGGMRAPVAAEPGKVSE
jgi:AcrR family transcriptional regulator